MDPAIILEQMAPLRAPAPIGWWPPAPGWWLLAAAALAMLIILMVLARRRWRSRRYRRQALARLQQLSSNGTLSLERLNNVLKATAMRGFPAIDVARLHGERWRQFLAETAPKLTTDAWAELDNTYRTPDESASDTLTQLARQWLKHHRRSHD